MSLYLRQVAFVAEKLQPVVDDLRSILGLEVCYVDEEVGAFGLENSLLPIGTNFIEVVAPIRAGTAGERYLKRRDGDGGYMVITQADGPDDQLAHRTRAEQLGIRVAWDHEHKSGRFMQLHPADTGGAFFEIDYAVANDPLGDWPPAGGGGWEKFVRNEFVHAITAVELQSSDPTTLAKRWSAIAATELNRDGGDRIVLPLRNAEIRFVEEVDGRGEGLSAVDLEVQDVKSVLIKAEKRGASTGEARVTIGGVRLNLVAK
ncbi:MAG: hypothetical protein ACI9BW_004094 [Gammaproteobacteria bacterium]|jgi:hypothetical protein